MYRMTKEKQNMSNGSHCVPLIPLRMSIQVCNQNKMIFIYFLFVYSLSSFTTFLSIFDILCCSFISTDYVFYSKKITINLRRWVLNLKCLNTPYTTIYDKKRLFCDLFWGGGLIILIGGIRTYHKRIMNIYL